MITYTVQLRKYRANTDGTYPIAIRVYNSKNTRIVHVGFSVLPGQFREKDRVWVYKHPDATQINGAILDKLAELKTEKPVIRESASLSAYLEKRAKQFKEAGRVDMDRKLRRQNAEIKEMLLGRDATFGEINTDWIRDYAAFNKKNFSNANNTIMRKIKNLRTIYKQAISDGWARHPNPFEDFKLHFTPVDKQKLNREELTKVEDVKLDIPAEVHARNAFVFAFYAHGMRFENIFTLEWSVIRDGKLEYRMNKGKKIREIELHPKALAILDQYDKATKWVFPFCKVQWTDPEDFMNKKGSANAMVNSALKIVAAKAGVNKPVSTHIARHSFAYLMKTKGVNQNIIKDALGHTSMSTTEAYLNALDDDEINAEVNRVFDM